VTLQATPEATSSPSPEPSPAEQLQSDFKERVRAGLEKAGHTRVEEDIRDSEVLDDDPPDPKAGKGKEASTAPAGGKTAEPDKTETKEETERAAPQPRYDSKSFSKWIENNPDKAAELATKVFKTQLGGNAESWKKHFIAAENKRRRQSEQDEATQSAIAAEKAEVERLAKEAREPIEPILSLLEAEQKEDFPAIDRFIKEAFNVDFDEYCRRRLRGLGKETVTERALKQKVAALEAKLEGGSKTEAPKEKEASPAVSERWVEKEIPADHGVRDLEGWKKKVTAVYEKSKDPETDEYEMSIEEAAQSVLDDFLAKRTQRPPANDRSSRRPPQRTEARSERRTKTWTDDDEDKTPARDLEEDQAKPDVLDYAATTRRALARAAQRAAR
jgi:hypothetical protein